MIDVIDVIDVNDVNGVIVQQMTVCLRIEHVTRGNIKRKGMHVIQPHQASCLS